MEEMVKRMETEDTPFIEGKNFTIQKRFYKNQFKSILNEGFSNLGDNIISQLIKDNLLKVSDTLNPNEYAIF